MHATLCDFVSDIVQNSIEANSRLIEVDVEENGNKMRFTITDDGKGMDEHTLNVVLDPFYTDGIKHKSRTVGLGLPFLKQTVDAVGGDFSIESEVGEGTTVKCSFLTDHIDCPPLGDLVTTIMMLLTYPGKHELVVTHTIRNGARRQGYSVAKSEMLEALGEVETSGSLMLLKKYLQSQEDSIEDNEIHA
ncbi:MAG: ATP-binding protein [Sphaerochaetaceae bacterium]|nr:ATP-binding protein [Sphaerochaetaceae bacterium]NLO60750.1 sensor histidine kinase [Spirochaetales bacterium]MDD2406089.1 ATP-binding protein [Sphaerochaetaceae bacterium]MDD3670083.1 ATP-binding protein [Sphaerochaetaceae bacterium]MDD4260251.1 ATP-binding protein [Sphaerochaetaceae bacterium]